MNSMRVFGGSLTINGGLLSWSGSLSDDITSILQPLGPKGATFNTAVVTFANPITGSGGITKTGNNLTLAAVNTYDGPTIVMSGALTLGVNDALPDTTAVSLASGTTLNLAGFSDTIGSLAGAGTTNLGSGTLTTGGDNTATTFSGVISGTDGSLTKTGTGTFTLTGTNTYTGGTTLSGGTLVVDGSIASSSLTTVMNGGTLGGHGTVGAVLIANGGTLAPGNSPGLLTITGDLTLAGILQIELAGTGTRGLDYDALDVSGLLTLGGTLNLIAYDHYAPTVGDSFQLFNFGSISGSFTTVNLTGFGPGSGFTYDPSALLTTGWLTITDVSAVPEPGTYAALVGVIALGLAGRRRRSRKR